MARFWFECAFVIAVAAATFSYMNTADRESLHGKKVLVTGASQNIGEELAYQYAKLGAKLVITARRESVLKKVVEKCKELGAQEASYLVADMSNTEVYESLIEDAVKILGGLDILVLNHVISRHGRWNGSREDLEFLEKSIPVNYLSYVRLANAAMPSLKRVKGQLVVVASQAGRHGIPKVASYGATKSAVINFFSSLQLEAIESGDEYPSITICILGAINTKEARLVLAEQRLKLQGYPVPDTALAIIDGGINRARYTYSPSYLRLLTLAREISPEWFDKILIYFVL